MNEDRIVEQIIEELERGERKLLRTTSGAVVEVFSMPDALMQLLWKQNPEPKPPMVEIESGGRKWKEENPDSPAYVRALEQHTLKISDAMINLALLKAVKIVELPEGVSPFDEDEDWEEEMAALGVEIPEGRVQRKLTWLRYRIAPSTEDFTRIQSASAELSGISESEVEAVMKSRFPRLLGRDTGSGETTEAS